MFGKMMYYDKKTIDEYKSIISGKQPLHIEEYEVSNDKGANIDLKALSASANANKKYVAKVVESMLYDCNEFEKSLHGRDDYFDFTESQDYDFSTVLRGSIVKAEAFIEIPEKFDIMQIINRFKPMLLDSLNTTQIEQSGKEILKAILSTNKTLKIPIICDVDDYLLCAKLNQDHLISDYEEIEEIDEQVTILARLSSDIVSENKPFYDPLKDFLTINRTMRRNMKERKEGLDPLCVDKEYRRIDILAIYR